MPPAVHSSKLTGPTLPPQVEQSNSGRGVRQSLDDIKKDAQEFEAVVESLKQKGYNIEFDFSLYGTAATDEIRIADHQGMISEPWKYGKLNALQSIPPELRADCQPLRVSPFFVTSELNTETPGKLIVHVRVIDYLNTSNPIVVDDKIEIPNAGAPNKKSSGGIFGRLLLEDYDLLAKWREQGLPDFKRKLNSSLMLRTIGHSWNLAQSVKQPEKSEFPIKVMEDNSMSAVNFESLEEIFKVYPQIQLIPFSENSKYSMYGGAVLTADHLKRLRYNRLFISERCEAIKLVRVMPPESTELKSRRGKTDAVEEFTDKYGNIITREFSTDPENLSMNLEVVTIKLRTNLDQLDSGKNSYADVVVDLKPLGNGLSELRGLLCAALAKPISHKGKLTFVTHGDSRRIASEHPTSLDEIENAVLDHAKYLGNPHAVKKVYIADTEEKNGTFDIGNSDLITLTEGILDTSVTIVAVHETTHLIDRLYSSQLSSGRIELLHKRLSRAGRPDSFQKIKENEIDKQREKLEAEKNAAELFFHNINESTFLGGYGGHAQDSPAELLCSLVSSLTHPQWETKIRSLAPSSQKLYYEALLALQSNIQNIPEFPKDAFIRADLKTKIISLEKILEATSHDDTVSLMMKLLPLPNIETIV